MKYIKLFEKLDIYEPQVDDYVICTDSLNFDPDLTTLVSNSIGKIISIDYSLGISDCEFKIFFDDSNFDFLIPFKRNEILHWSENKEDLLIYIDTNKYNI